MSDQTDIQEEFTLRVLFNRLNKYKRTEKRIELTKKLVTCLFISDDSYIPTKQDCDFRKANKLDSIKIKELIELVHEITEKFPHDKCSLTVFHEEDSKSIILHMEFWVSISFEGKSGSHPVSKCGWPFSPMPRIVVAEIN